MFVHSSREKDATKFRFSLPVYEWLFVAMSCVIPLSIYSVRVMGLGLSLDRLLLVFLLLGLPSYLSQRGASLRWPQYLALLGVGSVFLSIFSGAGLDSYAIRFVPSMLQGYVLLAVGSIVFANNFRANRILILIFSVWAVIFAVFSLHMCYYYYVRGELAVPFPFIGFVSDMNIHMFNMMRDRRLFMPLSSAPHLGAVTGFLVLWLTMAYLNCRRVPLLLLAIPLFVICVLTFSRGPLLAVFLSGFTFLFLGQFTGAVKIDFRMVLLLFFAVLLFGLYGYFKKVQLDVFGSIKSDRLMINFEEILHGRHLMLRLSAFSLFADGNPLQMITGQGFGAFSKYGVGEYSFASYLTLLVEVGLFGATVFCLVYLIPILVFFRKLTRHRSFRNWALLLLASSIALAIMHFFYELKTLTPLWLLTSYISGLAVSQNEVTAQSFEGLRPGSRSVL